MHQYEHVTDLLQTASMTYIILQIEVWKTVDIATNRRRVWRYQRDNQNPEIEDTMANRQMTINDLQITAMKTKDRGTWTQPKTGNELRCSGRVSSSCSISGTRHLTVVKTSVISHGWGMNHWDTSHSLFVLCQSNNYTPLFFILSKCANYY